MVSNYARPLRCHSCGERLPSSGDADEVTVHCYSCRSASDSSPTERPENGALKEVWRNLSAMNTWGQVAGWAILCGTTFLPVMVLWGANRIKPGEALLPVCVGISMLGGAVGMSLLYPKKGYWLPGVIAGPLFGPGVFLAFWLLAGNVMDRLILFALTVLGGGPSYALYVLLLYRMARRSKA